MKGVLVGHEVREYDTGLQQTYANIYYYRSYKNGRRIISTDEMPITQKMFLNYTQSFTNWDIRKERDKRGVKLTRYCKRIEQPEERPAPTPTQGNLF